MHLSRSFSRCAFSLIEVMISLAMLAIIITAVFSQMFTLQSASTLNRHRAAVSSLTLALSNAFAGAPFDQLRSTTLKWSMGRYVPTPTATPPLTAIALIAGIDATLPMTDDPAAPAANSLLRFTATGAAGLGVLASPTGLKNLKVWIEYYRGSDFDLNGDGIIQTTAAAKEIGLLDSPPTGLGSLMLPHSVYVNHQGIFQNPLLVNYRLDAQPADQSDPEGTIIIRVVMTYQIQSLAATGSNNAPVDFMSSFVIARRR